jgi:mannosyltransferase OCH1-like enzyme
MGRSVIQSLWIGSPLTNNERLCLRSFVHHGHPFHLYLYEPVPDLPDGVTVKDANEIIPKERLFLDSRNSYASFSDWFRLRLLLQRPGWWVDMDVVCMQPFDDTGDHCFSSEMHYNRRDSVLNNTVIRIPAGAPLLCELIEALELRLKEGGAIKWGEIGIDLFRKVVSRHEEMSAFVQPPDIFCPMPYYNLSDLICKSDYEPAGQTRAIHLWNEIWRGGSLDKNAEYHCDSAYERLKRMYL